MNPWQMYDELIGGIPEDITVTCCNTGYNWTTLISSEDSAGIAKTIPAYNLPYSYQGQMAGAKLRQIAQLSKSWNFVEAAIGVAALGAYYNHPTRAPECGRLHPSVTAEKQNVFDLYREEVKGLNVTVIGRFPGPDEKLGTISKLTVLERDPQWGDIPDSACEYILPEQDYVFITGCTLVNKTLPRLLELSKNAKVVIVGPSTIISPIMFNYGVYGLSGMTVRDCAYLDTVMREGNPPMLFRAGEMVNQIR